MSAAEKSVDHDVQSMLNDQNRRSKTKFHSMDDECISSVFDWLSIAELCRVKVTCKRLYLLANEHYRRTYYEHSNTGTKYFLSFASLFQGVLVYNPIESVINMCRKFSENSKHVKILTLIRPQRFNPDLSDINSRKLLKNIKAIFVRELFDGFLQHFTNLEYLIYFICGEHAPPLLGNYPTLKQIDWEHWDNCKIPNMIEMENFFKRHPNIKVFSSDAPNDTTQWLLETGIKFDDLVLTIKAKRFENIDQIIENVHALYKNHQIKKLHLRISTKDISFLSKFSTLKLLEGLQFSGRVSIKDHEVLNAITSLSNLKFLVFYPASPCAHDFKVLTQHLFQLEEFHTNTRNIDDIIPIVRYSQKLKCLYIKRFLDDIKTTATLQKLNKERRELENACKLTIYLDEKYYLQIKNNSSTNSYGLVEIKRTNSYPFSKHPLRPECCLLLE